jgi:hypothetical protein
MRGQHLADAAAEAAPRAAVNDATVNAQAVPHFKAFLDNEHDPTHKNRWIGRK